MRSGLATGPRTAIVPTFVLYDYSFRPDDGAAGGRRRVGGGDGRALRRRRSAGARSRTRRGSRGATRASPRPRRGSTRFRADTRIVLVNHLPLRRDHAVLPRIPRFSIWCGTRATERLASRAIRIDTVVYGHLHLRSTRALDGVRFEEVSLGYPKQWNVARGLQSYLREILSVQFALASLALPVRGAFARCGFGGFAGCRCARRSARAGSAQRHQGAANAAPPAARAQRREPAVRRSAQRVRRTTLQPRSGELRRAAGARRGAQRLVFLRETEAQHRPARDPCRGTPSTGSTRRRAP